MKRDDISDYVVHFIKGDTFDHAFETLRKILKEMRLLGGTGYIKGGYRCVCFSEAPVHHLGSALTRPTVHGVRYRPFGVVVSKSWLFARGGRPVIYRPDEEFLSLPDRMRWRHVRYEPAADPPIDFSWEREWRVKTDIAALVQRSHALFCRLTSGFISFVVPMTVRSLMMPRSISLFSETLLGEWSRSSRGQPRFLNALPLNNPLQPTAADPSVYFRGGGFGAPWLYRCAVSGG